MIFSNNLIDHFYSITALPQWFQKSIRIALGSSLAADYMMPPSKSVPLVLRDA